MSERCVLTKEDNKDDKLIFKVEQLPQSILYYVFSFDSLKDEEKIIIIKCIIQKLFTVEEESKCSTETISKCHIILRKTLGVPPILSLREIPRFTKCV